MVLGDCALALWAKSDIAMLIVDHGLREDSSVQAKRVAHYWQKQGVRAHILSLPPYLHGNKMAWARTQRYKALDAWCGAHGFPLLLLGHQADDVAENFLIRLSRKSGIYGLAMMQPSFYLSHVQVLRPMLPIFREQIECHQNACNIPIEHDPSNEDATFQRVHIRKLLKDGIYWNKKSLFSISNVLAKITHNIEEEIDLMLCKVHFTYHKNRGEELYIESTFFFRQHHALQRILLRRMIEYLTESYPPKEKQIQAGLTQLRQHKKCMIGRTICAVKRGKLWLTLTLAHAPSES